MDPPFNPNTTKTEHSRNFYQNVKKFLNNITIEPIFILAILSRAISIMAVQHLTLEKGCRVNLALDEEVCNALTIRNESFPNYKIYEQEVQTLSANTFIWRDIIIASFPSFLLLFVGSWSDRHNKRKQILLNCVLADIITGAFYLICTYFFYSLPMEVSILSEALPQAITGGFSVVQVGIMSYLSGITNEKNRTTRIGIFQFGVSFSMCLGTLLTGILFQEIKFYGVFTLSFVLVIASFLYGVFFVKDIWEYEGDKGEVDLNLRRKPFIKDFFDFNNISKTFSVAFCKRENRGRPKIWLLLIMGLLIMGPYRGEMNMSYYYLKYKFSWSPVQFSIFSTFESVILLFGNLISVILLTKKLKVHDCLLGIISCGSKIIGCLLYAFGPSSSYMYIGAIGSLFRDISIIALKSLASKLVAHDELGRLYSLMCLAETFAPIIYSSMYSTVYTKTLSTFPGTFYVLSTLSSIPGVLIFGWMYYQWIKEQRKSVKDRSNEEKPLTRSM